MSLWGGRFTKNSHKSFKKFNSSLKWDCRLIKEDIFSTIAWSKILVDANILTIKEQALIENTLNVILKKNASNLKEILNSNEEDIHSWLENLLIQKIGNVGKKLYSSRSRNEQIATDLKLWCKKKVIFVSKKIIKLLHILLNCAKRYKFSVFPGYTHLQKAQPITFSYWCLAYFEMLKRDYLHLQDVSKYLNSSPLGSGALSGTSLKIDRNKLAKLMNFSKSTNNALDSVSNRDFLTDILYIASIGMMHLSRFAEDFIFYNSGEVNFIELSDSITSGSSLMPQKKNPDILELIRAKCSDVYGSLFSILSLLKSLPLSYNKDLQEDKKHLFRGIDTWEECLDMVCLTLENFKLNDENCRVSVQKGYLNATELAEYLVSKQISFRDAHDIVGHIVLTAIKKKKTLEELSLQDFQKHHPVISQDVYNYLKIDSCLSKRNALGGTSLTQIDISLKNAEKYLNNI